MDVNLSGKIAVTLSSAVDTTAACPTKTTCGDPTRPSRDGHMDTGGCRIVMVWNSLEEMGQPGMWRVLKHSDFSGSMSCSFWRDVSQSVHSIWSTRLSTKIRVSQNERTDHSIEHSKHIQTECPNKCSQRGIYKKEGLAEKVALLTELDKKIPSGEKHQ